MLIIRICNTKNSAQKSLKRPKKAKKTPEKHQKNTRKIEKPARKPKENRDTHLSGQKTGKYMDASSESGVISDFLSRNGQKSGKPADQVFFSPQAVQGSEVLL